MGDNGIGPAATFMIVLGIDPGLTGGLALIESGDRPRVLFACDIPCIGADAKKRIHVRRVLEIIQKFKPDRGLIERAQAMPSIMKDGKKKGQGASSAFIYGRAVGALEACVEGMRIPLEVIESTAWKKHHGLIKPADYPSDEWKKVVKKHSRAKAILLYPDSKFWPREQDHGIAEAALIADYGLALYTGRASPKSPVSPSKSRPKSNQLDLIDAVNASSLDTSGVKV